MAKKDTYHGLATELKFNGKKYEQHSRYAVKRDAEREARFLRSKGWGARIVSISLPDYKYAIYVRRS